MKKLIITGGCGFIGSHIVEQFIDKNYEITVVDLWLSPEIDELLKKNKNLKFEKIDVNGDNAHPLYKHLKSTVKGIMGTERIKWNFTKFLINREGEVVARYGSQKKPADIAKDISSLL